VTSWPTVSFLGSTLLHEVIFIPQIWRVTNFNFWTVINRQFLFKISSCVGICEFMPCILFEVQHTTNTGEVSGARQNRRSFVKGTMLKFTSPVDRMFVMVLWSINYSRTVNNTCFFRKSCLHSLVALLRADMSCSSAEYCS
jgi:hypothetical protein